MKLDGIEAVSPPLAGLFGSHAPPRSGSDFAAQLQALLRHADAEQKGAEHQAAELAADRGDVVETMVALSKADLSLRTVVEVRNRAIEAVNEILRLQV